MGTLCFSLYLVFNNYVFKNVFVCNFLVLYFRREREFKVTIKFAARKELDHLRQFLAGRQQDNPQETIQALDVVLRESASKE